MRRCVASPRACGELVRICKTGKRSRRKYNKLVSVSRSSYLPPFNPTFQNTTTYLLSKMGKCLGCGCGISTFLNLPAWCTRCAGFKSPIQKEHLDRAAAEALSQGIKSLFG